jgi:hypothetical protein
MKPYFIKGIILIPLIIAQSLFAQHKLSLDMATIRQINHDAGGLNVSSFYYFNRHLVGGVEVNRFFPVNRIVHEEEARLSAWDFEINFHYLMPVAKHWRVYPITGISHTSEKELNPLTHQSHYERFWSVNTGGGLLFESGRWLPHIEYSFTWGHLNQRFFLAGLSYELDLGNHKAAH